ncbi:MAG: type IV toxin-antitoxin system AbiEi family antitoxin domain-containing protein [Gammaproteobacteria bacterium]|nr:type IV toxin-antitoxin system AbiEi family antitoxin domain-containing protein [Gammaproteobacteria bacterium]
MNSRYKSQFKTLGPRAAQLITELNERHRSTFTLADVESITGLSSVACRNLVHKAQQRGLLTRLKPGLYNLVPFQMGRASEYVDDPRLIAHELVQPNRYYVSHGSAFEIHRMVAQPILTMHVSCTRRLRSQTVGGYPFKFIHVHDSQVFGIKKHWVHEQQYVMVSDIERTIIDGLRHPALLGGITEIGKGLWMKQEAMNVQRLVEYAKRLGVGAVVRRLGYLLELYELANASTLDDLRTLLTNTYQLLDPVLPNEGRHLSRWRLQLNVSPEELSAVRFG